MKTLEDLAQNHPAFVTQLVAVIEGRKPVVRMEFDLEADDYARFIELLIRHRLIWFEHSPFPIAICYPPTLHENLKRHVRICESWVRNGEKNYPFLRLMTEMNDYDSFWNSFYKGEPSSFLLSGGATGSIFETIVAKDFEGLRDFLIQYAIARKQKEDFDKIFGMAFGYPECCAEKWNQDKKQKQPREDYILYESIVEKGLERTVPIELKVVGHVPCDVLCKPSLSLGRDYLDTLRDFDLKLYGVVIEELRKPTLFIDMQRFFTIDELEYSSIEDSVRMKQKDFLGKVNEEMDTKPEEVTLGSIKTVPFLYLADYVGLWWIAVNPGDSILLCNANTGETRLYKKDEKTSIADLRIYRCKG